MENLSEKERRDEGAAWHDENNDKKEDRKSSSAPLTRAAFWVATLGGLGRLTKMPGTLGSAAACIVYALCRPHWGVIAAVAALGTWAAGHHAKALGVEDPGEVVIDEVIGMWLTMWALPPSFMWGAFFVFRVLDIMKPVPICTAEKLPGGLGIMADDIVGGVIGNVLLQGVNWLLYGQGWLRAIFI